MDAKRLINATSKKRVFLDVSSLTQWSEDGLFQRFPKAEKFTIRGFETQTLGECEKRGTCYASVLNDGGKLRMWYNGIPSAIDHAENADHFVACYAESDDGIDWKKPSLKITGEKVYPGNNLIPLPGVCMGVVRALPGSKYKYIAVAIQIMKLDSFINDPGDIEDNGTGTYIFGSDDGFRWKQITKYPIIRHGDWATIYADEPTGRYLLYNKVGSLFGLNSRRFTIGVESRDAEHWEGYDGVRKWHECFVTDDFDDLISANMGLLISDVYGVGIYRSGEILVSVENIFDVGGPLVNKFSQTPNGLCHFRLGYSYDGLIWKHPKGRPAWLELGTPGEEDAGFISKANSFAEYKDELLFYYGGSRYDHGWSIDKDFKFKKEISLEEQNDSGRLMLAKIKKDRFASLSSPYRGTFDVDAGYRLGDELTVNAQAKNGYVRVAIAESDPYHGALRKNDYLPGYSFEDCVPVIGDYVSAPVRFKNKKIAEIPKDKYLSLRFELYRSEVFGYEWV